MGWELDLGSTHVVSRVFSKIIENWFLLLREPESRFSAWFSQNAIHGDSQSENQTENRDENQILLWEPPNTRPDYWSGPLVPSNKKLAKTGTECNSVKLKNSWNWRRFFNRYYYRRTLLGPKHIRWRRDRFPHSLCVYRKYAYIYISMLLILKNFFLWCSWNWKIDWVTCSCLKDYWNSPNEFETLDLFKG